jgi:transporter family-2 protein
VLAALAGTALSTQVPINTALARHLGNPLAAAAVSFAIGGALLVAATAATDRGAASFEALRTVPLPILLTGGCLGAFYVTTSIVAAPRIGTFALVAFVIAGQLAAAAAIDHFGLLGLVPRELSPARLAGLIAVFAGALLVRLG